MELFKLIHVLACDKCKVKMHPAWYFDGIHGGPMCCLTPMLPKGKTNYKCPDCGGSRDINHDHK